MRLAVTPTLATDRDFDKRNAIADVAAELFFRGLYNIGVAKVLRSGLGANADDALQRISR
jgi:hypothetical protein